MSKELTAYQQLKILVPEQKANFIRWYLEDDNTRDNFETFSAKYLQGKNIDLCMTWLMESNVQKAIKFWMGLIEQQNLIKLYKSMYKKALDGSTDAANWIIRFKDSGYFEDKQSELELLLKGIDIEND